MQGIYLHSTAQKYQRQRSVIKPIPTTDSKLLASYFCLSGESRSTQPLLKCSPFVTASFFLFAVSRGDGATSPCSSMSQIDQIHPWAAHLMSASQWHPHPTAGSLLLGGWRRSTAWDRLHRGQGGNTNASSGAWQGCSALPITGLTQIISQCGEPE